MTRGNRRGYREEGAEEDLGEGLEGGGVTRDDRERREQRMERSGNEKTGWRGRKRKS